MIHFSYQINCKLILRMCLREIYYQEIDIMSNQQMVDYTLLIIGYLLNCPPWELNVMSSAKGLVAGPLYMKTCDNIIIDFTAPGGEIYE